MTDLPYAQPIFDNDPEKEGKDNTPVTPSSSFGESAEMRTTIESSFSPESAKPTETLKSPESIPVPKPETVKETEISTNSSIQQNQTDSTKHVVDKTNQITTLHDIKPTKDKLTLNADEEEERFIEEVERHHGNL